MKNLIKYGFIAVVSCFLIGCEHKASRWVCDTCEQREKIAVFISKNMKNASTI